MYIRWNYINDEMRLMGIDNAKMARLLGISEPTWSRYKNGKTEITLRVFYELLKILDLNFYEVVKANELSEPKDNVKDLITRIEEVKKMSLNLKFKE